MKPKLDLLGDDFASFLLLARKVFVRLSSHRQIIWLIRLVGVSSQKEADKGGNDVGELSVRVIWA